MDGNKILSELKKLSEINSIKDVKQLTSALFPGTHCPLMGAALVSKGIKDSMLLLVGTDECAYYTKKMTIGSKDFGGLNGRCASVIVDSRDITFGSTEKIVSAFYELIEEKKPSCVFLVSTCVIEINGDDIDAIAYSLSEDSNIPVLPVHTEHFKSVNHIPGIERAITVCSELMEEHECDDSVNIVGQRSGNFRKTEVYKILDAANVKIGMMLPCGCNVEEIKNASKAKVNVVVDATALKLAKKMKDKFGTPYVEFQRFVDPEKIYEAYKMLFEKLEIELPIELDEKYNTVVEYVKERKPELENVKFIYGNTPFIPFELCTYLSKLNMEPMLIQMSTYSPSDEKYAEIIAEKYNPYVTKSANIAPLQYVYDVLKPDLYLGHEFPTRLMKKGIAIVHTDMASSMLGFEVSKFIIDVCVIASKQSKQYKENIKNGIM